MKDHSKSRLILVIAAAVFHPSDAFLQSFISVGVQQNPLVFSKLTKIRKNKMNVSERDYDDYLCADPKIENEGEALNHQSRTVQSDNDEADTLHHIQHDYRLADDAADAQIHSSCHLADDQIHRIIAARQHYKRTRQYSKADKLLQGLNRAGVFVHDKRMEWRADGHRSFGQSSESRYVRRGGNPDSVSNDMLREISLLVETRSRAKKQRDFVQCDELEAKLKNYFDVQIDDKRREWCFASSTTNDYVPSPLALDDDPTSTMDEGSKFEIQQLLQQRKDARARKNYKQSDDIRNSLLEIHNVVIDDRTCEWKVITDWKDESDPFVSGAMASQRSAFARKHSEKESTATQTEQERNEASANVVINNDSGDDISMKSGIAMKNDGVYLSMEGISTKMVSLDNDADTDTTTATESDILIQENRAILSSLTVVILKERLRGAGLPVSGPKAELVDRLLSAE